MDRYRHEDEPLHLAVVASCGVWEDRGVDGWDVGIWTGLGWPRIETGGGRL